MTRVSPSGAWEGSGLLRLGGVDFDLLLVRLQLLLLDLLRTLHRRADLGFHIRDSDHDEARLTLVQGFAELLEVSPAHAGRRVAGQRTEDRARTGRAEQQASTDGGGRKEDDHETRRQADTAAEHSSDARRRLVFLHDLDLALAVAL